MLSIEIRNCIRFFEPKGQSSMMIDDEERYIGTLETKDFRSKEEQKNTFFIVHDLDGNELVDCIYEGNKKLARNTFIIRSI